jgi:hypothetical protein
MRIEVLALAAVLAATCRHADPTGTGPIPPPDPVTDFPPDDASAPVNDPPTQCEVAWSVMSDAECAPATGHAAWMAKCVKFPQPTIDCVMTAESCATMRNCQGFE